MSSDDAVAIDITVNKAPVIHFQGVPEGCTVFVTPFVADTGEVYGTQENIPCTSGETAKGMTFSGSDKGSYYFTAWCEVDGQMFIGRAGPLTVPSIFGGITITMFTKLAFLSDPVGDGVIAYA